MKVIISILLSLILCCSHTIQRNDTVANVFDKVTIKEKKIVIINDSNKVKYIADDFTSFWIPNEVQMKIIDSILLVGINEKEEFYYERLKPDSINIFYRQYVCFIEANGDSIIYINALCWIPEYPTTDENNKVVWRKIDWQKELINVRDGGDCFWRVWINLTRKRYFKFMVNGIA